MADDEDLSHYQTQPDRLIEEFRKLKTAKKKAEQFAVEAKQSAQKVDMLPSYIKPMQNSMYSNSSSNEKH